MKKNPPFTIMVFVTLQAIVACEILKANGEIPEGAKIEYLKRSASLPKGIETQIREGKVLVLGHPLGEYDRLAFANRTTLANAVVEKFNLSPSVQIKALKTAANLSTTASGSNGASLKSAYESTLANFQGDQNAPQKAAEHMQTEIGKFLQNEAKFAKIAEGVLQREVGDGFANINLGEMADREITLCLISNKVEFDCNEVLEHIRAIQEKGKKNSPDILVMVTPNSVKVGVTRHAESVLTPIAEVFKSKQYKFKPEDAVTSFESSLSYQAKFSSIEENWKNVQEVLKGVTEKISEWNRVATTV